MRSNALENLGIKSRIQGVKVHRSVGKKIGSVVLGYRNEMVLEKSSSFL